MKKFFFLLTFILLSTTVWSQDYMDQYPEEDPSLLENGEFSNSRSLPPSDYEEVPREEQEYIPDQEMMENLPPEEIYESDEEYFE